MSISLSLLPLDSHLLLIFLLGGLPQQQFLLSCLFFGLTHKLILLRELGHQILVRLSLPSDLFLGWRFALRTLWFH